MEWYVPREAPFPIPLKYIDVTKAASTSLDVMLKKKIEDYWNVDGDQDLSDTWTSFTRFTMLDEKPPDGCTWSRERLTRKQTTPRPDSPWPEIWKDMSETSKRKEKQKWAVEKPKLVGSSDAISNALQNQTRREQGETSSVLDNCKTIRMHRRSRGIYEKAYSRSSS